MGKELTDQQRKFVNAWSGNIKETAKAAGMDYSYCRKLATKVHIMDAIRNRQDTQQIPLIATRQARQTFWTKTMQDADGEMRDRLRASELLGKSEADFTEKSEVRVNVEFENISDEALDARIASLEQETTDDP